MRRRVAFCIALGAAGCTKGDPENDADAGSLVSDAQQTSTDAQNMLSDVQQNLPDGVTSDLPLAAPDAVDGQGMDVAIHADGGATPDAIVPTCPLPSAQLESCFRGLLFADCSGTDEPVVGCDGPNVQGSHCLWFERGCSAAGYDFRPACPSELQCLHPNVGFGRDPWTRDRSMNLTVEISTDGQMPGVPEVTCECTDGDCVWHAQDCEPQVQWRAKRYPDGTEQWKLPSMLTWKFNPIPSNEDPDHWSILLEADLFRIDGQPLARACLILGSDSDNQEQPNCEAAGSVSISRVPVLTEDVSGVTVQFDLDFALPQGESINYRGSF